VEGAELPNAGFRDKRRAESRGPEAHWSGRGAGGSGRATSRETERAILLYFGLSY